MKNWSQLWMEGTLWLEAQMAQARIARYRERISMAPTASLGPEAIIDNLQGDKECIVIGEHSYVRGRLLTIDGFVLSRDLRVLVRLVRRACEIKASIVEADEWETDVRSFLNFGHTVGHALEAATLYRGPNHGEAVAVGMVVATTLSVQRGMCPGEDLGRLKALLQAFGLPITLPTDPAEITRFVRYDKKIQSGQIRFVLLRGIGDATVASLETLGELETALTACA